MDKSVSAIILRQGAWYALEQTSRLLFSSVVLFDAGDWGTATGIAMLGREELGRSHILRKLAKEVDEGKHFSYDDVRNACENHVEKQRASVLSTTIRAQRGSGLANLLKTTMHEPPLSQNWQNASKELQVITDKKTKRTPNDRHEMRMKCFYIDIEPDSTRWSRPCDFTQDWAFEVIMEAVNDYANGRDKLRDEIIESDEPEMADARREMDPYPSLPLPQWPSMPVNYANAELTSG